MKKPRQKQLTRFLVPRTRLELARTKRSLPPQSSVSTNFTTWALPSFFVGRLSAPIAAPSEERLKLSFGSANIATILCFTK